LFPRQWWYVLRSSAAAQCADRELVTPMIRECGTGIAPIVPGHPLGWPARA
jgi:hypothetical protein